MKSSWLERVAQNCVTAQTLDQKWARAVFLTGMIPTVLLVVALSFLNISSYFVAFAAIILIATNLYMVLSVWQSTEYEFRNVYNLIDAVAQGDYSFRGLTHTGDSALNDVIKILNSLASNIQQQRYKSEENFLLVKKIVDHIDVAIIAFSHDASIQLLNPAATRLLNINANDLFTKVPDRLRIILDIEPGETHVVSFQLGRFRIHKEQFVLDGMVHNIAFVTNLSRILRREERKAWKNLLRVISHEVNNSVAPLSSYSSVLIKQVEAREIDPRLQEELVEGLTVIKNRARSMADFVARYKDISKLPEPVLQAVNIEDIVRRVAQLFPAGKVQFEGYSTIFHADPNLLEQALINVVKNGIEATEAHKVVTEPIGSRVECGAWISWTSKPSGFEIHISDAGGGIQSIENLFTPFFTTKKSGTGIGLIISRQIIESHNGQLALTNRQDSQGCLAVISLPNRVASLSLSVD